MGPFLSVIIASVAATLALDLRPRPDDVDRATATVLAIGMIVGAWVTSRAHHARVPAATRQPPWARPLDLAMFGLLVFGTDWVTVAREATADLPLLRQVMVLAPYFLAALARVEAAWPADHAEDRPHPWTRSRAVAFHARLLLIPIAPVILINGAIDALRRIPAFASVLDAYPAVESGIVLALFVAMIAAMPMLLSRILGTRPLPQGPLRTALLQDLARQGVRLGGIREVDTGGLIANAAYLGLTTRLGRIFISDALLQHMPEDEVRAVFAHETAHGTRRHLVWFLLFFVAIVVFLYVAGDLVPPSITGLSLSIALTTIAGAVGFVAISRRFEVEADLVGAETLGDPELFNRALVRVAALAGKPVDRHGVRHYAIAARTAIVHACATNPAAREAWRRRIRATKVVIAAFAAIAATGAAWKLPADLTLSRARFDYLASLAARSEADKSGEAERAAEPIRQRLHAAAERSREVLRHPLLGRRAAELGIASWMALADEALRRGDFDEARQIASEVESNWPSGDEIGDFNRKMLRAELLAIDPSRDLASLRSDVKATQEAFDDLMRGRPSDENSEMVNRELRFLAAAAGVEGATLPYDPDDFPSARHLALALGARGPRAETREIHREVERDHKWRQLVLYRALGDRAPQGKELFAAETRKGL